MRFFFQKRFLTLILGVRKCKIVRNNVLKRQNAVFKGIIKRFFRINGVESYITQIVVFTIRYHFYKTLLNNVFPFMYSKVRSGGRGRTSDP